MKLVIATPLYPPEPGGPATYAKALEEGLPGRGIEVSLVKFSEVRAYPRVLRHIAYFWKVYKAAKGADAVLALDPVSTGLPASFGARLRRAPLIVKIVGDFAWEQGRQRFGIEESLDEFVHREDVPLMVGLMRAVQTYVAHRATRIIVPSEYLRGIVHAWGIPAEKITVIYNAVEVGEVPNVDLPMSRPTLVTVGRLVPWKGIRGLINAVALLREKMPDANLLVVGDGPDREELASYGAEKLGDHVQFVGAKPHEETLAYMQAADALVLNSSYEGLSHTLIEALMLGSVIVASDAGGNPELIHEQENGLVVPVGDTQALAHALFQALSDEELRGRLQAGARASAHRFALDTMLEKTADFLMRV